MATIKTFIKTTKNNFAIVEVDEDAYSSAIVDLEAKKRAAELELVRLSVNLSNLASYIENTIRIACELGSYWNGGDFEVYHKIQKLVFPEGALWDHENRRFRTDGMNSVASYLF